MKRLALPTALALLLSAVSFAAVVSPAPAAGRLDFDTIDLDRYSDAPFDEYSTDLSVSVLTEEGILRGNDDGTFRPDNRLNRAEFVQIIMRLLNDNGTVNRNCFPDVSPSVWYAEPVCRAKALGIVRGNARVGVEQSLWRFEPTRDVQYEEAVKILIQVYAYPVAGDAEGMDWYVPYIDAAADMDLTIDGLVPGDRITRGEMARLTLAFLAHSEGQLGEYRDAEEGRSSSSSSMSSSSSSSSMSSRSSSSSSFSSDPDTNLTVRSNFLVLGEVTPVLGAVDFYAVSEPIDIDTISVRFLNDSSSIQQVRVYAEADGRLLGTSFRDGSGEYEISVPVGTMILPHREETGVYVRALMKPADGGATGGQTVQIERIELEGDGVWSNNDYTVVSNETFLAFETSPAVITGFSPATSLSSSVFISGPSVTLWDYNISARTTDNDFEPAVTSLTFRLAKSSNVTLSDAHLMVPDSGAESDCVISTGYITCDAIPESVGVVDDAQRIRLVADVDYSGAGGDPFVQVTLQEGGTPSNGGDVEWTDGRTNYDWLPIDAPVARGIDYQ